LDLICWIACLVNTLLLEWDLVCTFPAVSIRNILTVKIRTYLLNLRPL
jgi:hypothetical protein